MTLGLIIGMFTLFINNQMLTAELESMHSYEYVDTSVYNEMYEEEPLPLREDHIFKYEGSYPVFPDGDPYDR